MTTIVWLRRDLRLHDHAALATALEGQGSIQPVFIFDSQILARFSNKDDRRLSFIAATLCDIHEKLKKRGGGLLVFHGKPVEIIPRVVQALQARCVVCAEDFEPATIARDAAVKKALSATRFVAVLDHLALHPNRMRKADGTPYKVFTPFYKGCWRPQMGDGICGELTMKDRGRYLAYKKIDGALEIDKGPQTLLEQVGYRYAKDDTWTVNDAQERLKNFIAGHLAPYKTQRDFLAKAATSRLGPYLRHGLVSVRECMRAALEHGQGEGWIFELGWREFYAGILFHFPQVVDTEFNENYRHGAIQWSHSEKLKDAFMNAQTGYPVVDAAVRELRTTGWMHNRARMIVASFATKHLLLDWRIGEEFFAQYLMDYDLASNNGGWQWSASTGTDAQPYFRVFNPVLQSKKFDAGGDYIRHYLPELKHLSDKDIHAPWQSKNPPANYPKPIVDHDEARARVLEVFKAARR